MTQEEMICLAEEFVKWLEYMAEKYNCDKDDIQLLMKEFLK